MSNSSTPNTFQLIHHGAARGVTGSCHELRLGRDSLLIDCGQFQGEAAPARLAVSPARVRALLLTHAHIDHIGRLPELLSCGLNAPIYCSEATALLVPVMLTDALRHSSHDPRSAIEPVLQRLRHQLHPLPFAQWQRLPLSDGSVLYLRLQPAGHILGSAYLELRLPDGQLMVFSGDLGSGRSALLPASLSPERADFLVLESTYGDRLQPQGEPRHRQLKTVVERSLRDGGAILIPAFSIGRTQELLCDLEQILSEVSSREEQWCWRDLPVVIDSPLGADVTRLYRRFRRVWHKEAQARLQAGRHPLDFSQCVTIHDHAAHESLVHRLQQSGEPAIIVAGGGMCQGGRIVDYLKALLPDARTDLLLVGFQAQGTPGRRLQSGCRSLWLEGVEVEVQAHIHHLQGYSAHADQAGLLRFVEGMASPPAVIRLVHGEPEAQQSLAACLMKRWPQMRVELAAMMQAAQTESAG
ncbi:MBL fold metallo-hydrolase RNA specificity domain-containing protein [Pseudaeromonas sharmana]|uniref:MBL fold metallo-hydrolase RNA specificity domain-containing protein n=1 Tax=Pseudaeromonas sharmana TaxID=328412 RepID=A0ABV8CSK8_9GAMM